MEANLGLLPNELWLAVFRQCTTSTLHNLCLASSYLDGLCRPLLYEHVDISWHNSGRAQVFPPFAERMDVQLRQFAFLTTLEARPEYARHVRTFTWTLFLRAMKCLPADVLASWSVVRFYRMLRELYNVTSVDLDTGPLAFGQPPHFSTPLFPNATSIRLGGKMHYAFAVAVLHGKTVRFRRLALNNVQEAGWDTLHPPVRGGANPNDPSLERALLPAAISLVDEVWPEGQRPIKVGSGPMRRLLGPLVAQCEDLEELVVRVDMGCLSRSFVDSAIDEAFHAELAAFLEVVHPRVVVLEHGGDLPSMKQEMLMGFSGLVFPRLLARTVLAAIFNGPSLPQRLEVRGIDAAEMDAMRGELDGVEIVHDPARPPCWNCPTLPMPAEHFCREPRLLPKQRQGRDQAGTQPHS